MDLTNVAPVASNVNISGVLAKDSVLTGNYTYSDSNGDAETGTSYKWYASSDTSSTQTLISGAVTQTFTPTFNEVSKYVKFVIVPSDGELIGDSAASAWQGPVTGPVFAGGSGTEADPYQISTPTQLDSVRHYLDKHFILINDIDLDVAPYNTGEGWEPIGKAYQSNTDFSGSLNGDNYKIVNLFINAPTRGNLGLFGSAGNASISNINIDNVNITGEKNIGVLVGHVFLRHTEVNFFEKIHTSGIISGERNVGGLIGSVETSTNSRCENNIMNSTSSVSVNNTDSYISEANYGGLVGYISHGNCNSVVYQNKFSGNIYLGSRQLRVI